MSQEGYLQIKIRDLNEVVKELEGKIEEKKKEIEDIKIKIEKLVDNVHQDIKPLIEVNDKMGVINKHIEYTIEEKMDNYLNEFEKIMFSKNKKVLDSWTKAVLNIMHERIDNLIQILNKRGYTNITSYRYGIRKGGKLYPHGAIKTFNQKDQ